MGLFSAWSYTAKCTVWEPTLDEFGQPTGFARTVYACSFKAGGDMMLDDRGERFRPKTQIYLEAEDADAPKRGSYVQLSESSEDSPPDGAEVIRSTMVHDPSLFDEGTPDRVVVTG